MATLAQLAVKKGPFAIRARKRITRFSKGLSIILAAAAEPLMRYTTIYLALATALPAIKVDLLYGACQGVVIATPEFVIIGAFNIAEDAIREGQKVWGIILMIISIAMAGIMIATFVDIFIVQFNDLAIHLLNFARCIGAVGFTVVLGKLDKDDEEEQGQSVPQPSPQPQQSAAITDELTKAVEKIKEELSSQVAEGLQKIRADVLSHVHIEEDKPSNQSGQSHQLLAGPGDQKAANDAAMTSTNAERPAGNEEDTEQQTPEKKAANGPDKLELTIQFLRDHPGHITDETIDAQLAPILDLKRPASARFWRLKAVEMMNAEAANEAREQGAYSRLLAYVQAHQPTTQKEIAATLNISERSVRRHLAAMRKSGQLPAIWMENRTADSGQEIDDKADNEAAMSSANAERPADNVLLFRASR